MGNIIADIHKREDLAKALLVNTSIDIIQKTLLLARASEVGNFFFYFFLSSLFILNICTCISKLLVFTSDPTLN